MTRSENKIGGLSWSLKDDAQDDHELSYLKRLHSLVSSNFNVDPDRFYLVGHSRGAILTQYAAMKLNAELLRIARLLARKQERWDQEVKNKAGILEILASFASHTTHEWN